jgi:hypothetical protein
LLHLKKRETLPHDLLVLAGFLTNDAQDRREADLTDDFGQRRFAQPEFTLAWEAK